VVTPICIIIIIDSVRNNANWQAISYLLFYSQVWWILIQTVARTYMLIAAYSRRDPLPPQQLPQQLGSSLPLESSMPFDKIFCEAVDGGCQVVTYNVSGCGMASGAGAAWATSFVEIVLLCVFMLLDIFKRKAPMLRLLLAVLLAMYLIGEITARSTVKFPKEQQSSGALSSIFGKTAQDVIYTIDYAIFTLLMIAFATTLLRPDACAFMVLPCKDSTVLFFYRQDDRNRRLLGMRRLESIQLLRRMVTYRLRKWGRLACWKRSR